MGLSSGAAAFKLSFAISPIVMTGGIAANIPGGVLPVLSISDAISFVGGLLSPGDDVLDLDDYFAYFQPLPGGTLIDQTIGMYPFANQTVAANAVIQQPLAISMLMVCPAGRGGGYATKLATMQALVATFKQHNTSGGTYTILTPAYPYTDCVMLNIADVSSSATKQVQNAFKLDFLQPLVTLAAAQAAQNALMSQISSGVATDGSQSGGNTLLGSTSGATAPTVGIPASGQGAQGITSGAVGPFPGGSPFGL